MPRKILISFLGTNNYVPANYYLKDQSKKVSDVRFIQEALLELICNDWTDQDVVKIFLTKDAEKNNWCDNGHSRNDVPIPCEGLEFRLNAFAKNHQTKYAIEPVHNVPTGITESDIWDIFDTIYAELKENDEVYFDITHSFRSIPMLCMVLLNYAKYLKNITVKGIYYGAFEVLGPAYLVKNMDMSKRNAPIVDVTRFSLLQDWSIAASDFTTYGNGKRLSELANDSLHNLFADGGWKDPSLKALRKIINEIPAFSDDILLCRGRSIIKNSHASTIFENIKDIDANSITLRPLIPLIKNVELRLKDFSNGPGTQNGVEAAKWCLENNLIQQGLTILQETLITEACHEMNMNEISKGNRELISACFNIKIEDYPPEKWNTSACKDREFTKKILINSNVIAEKKEIFSQISTARNDINHSGMRETAAPPDRFYKSLKNVIKHFSFYKQNSSKDRLFINYSNHPSSHWCERQLQHGKKYGDIIDISFPEVQSDASKNDISKIAKESVEQIFNIVKNKDGILSAAHIMGEHTLCYTLVSKLQQRNITCVASTTERMVTQNGDEKISVFKFRSFRAYPEL